MDEYFGAVETTSYDNNREAHLEGISEDLLDGANAALDALDILRWTEFWMPEDEVEKWRKQTADIYREFSAADIDRDSDSGLQALINEQDKIWKALIDNSKSELDQAEKRLEHWRGDAANDVKAYINNLAHIYDRVGTKITVLESDVVAAREAIASARGDLVNLGESFKAVAEKYQEDKSKKSESAMLKVLGAAFAGAVAGLLTVATAGAGAAAGAAVLSATAKGAIIAGNVAGSAISASIANAAEITGDNIFELVSSFFEQTDKLRDAMVTSMEDLAKQIDIEAEDLPAIPPPPDVSPGSSFDPDSFETERLDKDRERRVRESGVDIAPDGQVDSAGGAPAPLT
ncbi:hypothetical protein [Amycolatopsis albispora]|uniref:Uncharacterized protein n=1 Tax=Amycolatopsis albispora TaxID=1804986 RepID=A0A344LIW0_9PSEU|nr:hypothetical protein [Amycolatopsis albispora]AXB47984.1 hypothetical protein A4R43_40670 [Amycolatopsis albispora]